MVQSPKSSPGAPSQEWLDHSFIIGQGSRAKNQIMKGTEKRKGRCCGFLEVKEFIPVQEAVGILWGVLNEGITSLDLWALIFLSLKMKKTDP